MKGASAYCMRRRDFIWSATVLAGLTAAHPGVARSTAPFPWPKGLIDVNVNMGRWPMRRMPFDEPRALVELLRSKGVWQAWTGSLDGLLHKDLSAVNVRLALECRRHGKGLLLPFGSVNPASPDWEEDLRRCAEEHRMPGIRLHPNYHGYTLESPGFARLLRFATEKGLIVQLAMAMEDERMMHPLLRVAPVNPAPLVDLVKATPGLRLVVLNAMNLVRGDLLTRLINAGDVCVETSMLDGAGCVGRLLQQVPFESVLFGSNAPMFYFDAAVLKLEESPLTLTQLRAVRAGNADRLMSRGAGRGSRTL